MKDCTKTIRYGDQLITGDLQDSNFSRLAPSILYLIIEKTKEICILVKITQNVWRMEMSLSFPKSTSI